MTLWLSSKLNKALIAQITELVEKITKVYDLTDFHLFTGKGIYIVQCAVPELDLSIDHSLLGAAIYATGSMVANKIESGDFQDVLIRSDLKHIYVTCLDKDLIVLIGVENSSTILKQADRLNNMLDKLRNILKEVNFSSWYSNEK